MAQAELVHITDVATAAFRSSPPRRPVEKGGAAPVFDPSSGEIHDAGWIILVPRQLSVLLALFVQAEGEVVPTERVQALTRPYGPYSEPFGRRRQAICRLRKLLAPLGIEIEHRVGFGYRLRGKIQIRAMREASL